MTVVNLQVSASTDDARNVSGNGTFNATVVTQHIGQNATVDYWNGWRWLNVTIPQGSTINSATIDLYSAGVGTGTSAPTIFYGEAADNPATFANTTAGKPEGRTHTSASVSKTFSPASWTATGFGIDTISVTSLIQEIVNRGGFASGNALVIVAHNNGSANNNYIGHSTYDSNVTRGAKLDIDYTAPGGGVTVTPSTASLTTSSFAPAVQLPTLVTAGLLAMALTAFAPSVSANNQQIVTPGLATLTVTQFVATVLTPRTATPGVVALSISEFAPQANLGVTPATGGLSLNTSAPTAATTANMVVSPDQLALILSAFTPSVVLGQIVTPCALSASTSSFAPSVAVSSGTFVTPATAHLSTTLFAPIANHSVGSRKYYIDTDGNVYWVLNQSLGLIEKI